MSSESYGPLDDFDTPDEDEGDSAPPLPEHDYVSPQCQHREHMACLKLCPVCGVGCLCVCHRWRIPVTVRPEPPS